MKRGATQFITETDLPSLPPKEEVSNLGNRLNAALEKQYAPLPPLSFFLALV